MPHGKTVHVVVFDGFADWEPAYALAELRRSGGRSVQTVGFTRAPVQSMGGLRVMPDVELAAVRPRNVELLLLPGGDMWESDAYPRAQLESLIGELLASSTPIAAICAGTLALGRAGALNDRRHTSNMRAYLPAHATEYSGASRYIEAPAVRDGHVITASGLAAIEFAREILAELDVFDEGENAVWFDMFKHGVIPDSEE